MNVSRLAALALAALLLLMAGPHPARAAAPINIIPVTGQLLVGGSPVTGNYDLQFQLYSAATGGTAFGPLVTVTNVAVEDGVFYAEVDFGNLNYGNPLYVQTSYRHAGTGSYTALTPRHVVPTAIYAANANYATASGNTYRLQGTSVSATAPTSNQALVYNGTAWTPATLPAPTAYTAGTGLTLSGSQFSVAAPLALSGSSSNAIVLGNNQGSGVGVSGGSTSGYGVYGGSVNSIGVYGYTGSASSNSVYGYNNGSGDYGLLGGVEPISGNSDPVGVFGSDDSPATTIQRAHPGANSSSSEPPGYGVYGNSVNNTGVYGTGAIGVSGYSSSGPGVYGSSNSGSAVSGDSSSGDGVNGYSGSGPGVNGYSGSGNAVNGYSPGGNGAYAYTDAASMKGVWGYNSSSGIGVEGQSNSGDGVYGYSGSGYAGYFDGNVNITGTLTASTKHFRIDDPLDPANKYLIHASIESDQMTDLYSGNVTTDARGVARVTMPHWFGALNKDPRYQLTVIGQFAQAIVAAKIHDNAFTIKTDKPNVEVSWQVTGVRQDASASAHPMQVEEVKPESERGLYLDPVAQGKPVSLGIGYARQSQRQAKN